jgi:hypothetical protein
MIYNLRLSSDQQINDLNDSPERIRKILYEETINYTPGFIAKLFGAKPKSDDWHPENFDEENDEVDLDKAWQAIHYLLTEDPWEGSGVKSFILNGGKEIGVIDVGYGPARSFSSDEVKEIHNELSEISSMDLRSKFDFELLSKNDIYPSIWDRKDPEDINYVINCFDIMKDFIKRAHDENKGLIAYTN